MQLLSLESHGLARETEHHEGLISLHQELKLIYKAESSRRLDNFDGTCRPVGVKQTMPTFTSSTLSKQLVDK